ncbi:hypothetical protein Q4530_02105 [Colwellia sp. 1_MG-2023]|jgi:hypothetical protein|uniref:hypothetical protein n=1 Tax=unclassified Colwellia TaxID=196834 RepID=UPI001C09C3B3|nr:MULTISPECIES: hypothetical protein [unclassified Colwellia]MBU2925235.1 hypothetical protein [Colwellia sp. C2M11]MDO6651240.1 hypothetical protein [Colwellia sp. 3_MG-2023]MDO6664337.1 hypothetical protein [Colwellia sp. 2_MG-2023]MDO6688549.1 hypothetical protein [Colwellia sp. 1_MG-2023]
MQRTFSKTFTLLQHEADLAEGCLSVGLTAIRNATVNDKRNFYSGFFNTTIAFERIMKLIVVIDHMLYHNFQTPTKKELKAYGHDLVSLYKSSVAATNRKNIASITMPSQSSIEMEILCLLSEFAKFTRYYNLDSLSLKSSNDVDPLIGWENIINKVIKEDVPSKQLYKRLDAAEKIHDSIKDITITNLHGMGGEALTLLEALSLPEKQSFAAPYLMVRVFNLLSPLINSLSELGTIGFYTRAPDGTGPHIPVFKETLVYFMADKSQIKKKKRWP